LNAFQPTSTFMREVRLYGTRGTGPECRRSRRNLNNPPRCALPCWRLKSRRQTLAFSGNCRSMSQWIPAGAGMACL
jgi:hypothetical protein